MSTPLQRRLMPYVRYGKPPGRKFKRFPPWYPTTPSQKLMPALPKDVQVIYKAKNFNNKWEFGADARMIYLAEKLTILFKYERIEQHYHAAVELRGYAERLIQTAIRYGDRHSPTMELADFWLQEKSLVHKLFKVLVPRYVNYTTSFTSLYKLPPRYQDAGLKSPYVDDRMKTKTTPLLIRSSMFMWKERGVLELKGNPLPPMQPPPPTNRLLLTNVLLSAAKSSYEGDPKKNKE